jgi:protein-S-isoprenylcysteine O-methyltransferase Ste14
MTMDALLRFTTLGLMILHFVYWTITEFQANTKKPLLQKRSYSQLFTRFVTWCLGGLLTIQLLGVDILSFKQSIAIQLFGFILCVIGLGVGFIARLAIGDNWAHGAEYQIKKDHTLVTHGIYGYIRHPIYTGTTLSYIGAEIVAGSYLFLFFALFLSLVIYRQGRNEENILTQKFGTAYTAYMKKTKMFLPFLW